MNDLRLLAPVSAGELIDKITILELKSARVPDAAKLRNINAELTELGAIWQTQPDRDLVSQAVDELREVNTALWEVEDQLRAAEKARRFDDAFIHAARSVYRLNDRRAALKYQINQTLGSHLVEEKWHVT